jgi:hypothetical protein
MIAEIDIFALCLSPSARSLDGLFQNRPKALQGDGATGLQRPLRRASRAIARNLASQFYVYKLLLVKPVKQGLGPEFLCVGFFVSCF